MALNEQQELINQITDEVEKRVMQKIEQRLSEEKQEGQQGKKEEISKAAETIKSVFQK